MNGRYQNALSCTEERTANMQMGWRDAAIAVLKNQPDGMLYTEIADAIISRGLRKSVGATPAGSVNVAISASIRDSGEHSPFERVSIGRYRLKAKTAGKISPSAGVVPPTLEEQQVAEKKESTGLINALGMYWARERVLWSATTTKLLGRQTAGSEAVDFSDQRGVYLLHDRNAVIYVGRAIDQGIGTRLRQHTYDRLSSRWERFSWFGIYGVSENGKLVEETQQFDRALLIATMEALLIESVEPTQNRRRGDDFRAVEFLQAEDPEIETMRMKSIFTQMQQKLGV